MNLATLESQKSMKPFTKLSIGSRIAENAIMLLIIAMYGFFAYFSIHVFSAYQNELTGLNQLLSPVKGGFYSEGVDEFVISSNRQT